MTPVWRFDKLTVESLAVIKTMGFVKSKMESERFSLQREWAAETGRALAQQTAFVEGMVKEFKDPEVANKFLSAYYLAVLSSVGPKTTLNDAGAVYAARFGTDLAEESIFSRDTTLNHHAVLVTAPGFQFNMPFFPSSGELPSLGGTSSVSMVSFGGNTFEFRNGHEANATWRRRVSVRPESDLDKEFIGPESLKIRASIISTSCSSRDRVVFLADTCAQKRANISDSGCRHCSFLAGNGLMTPLRRAQVEDFIKKDVEHSAHGNPSLRILNRTLSGGTPDTFDRGWDAAKWAIRIYEEANSGLAQPLQLNFQAEMMLSDRDQWDRIFIEMNEHLDKGIGLNVASNPEGLADSDKDLLVTGSKRNIPDEWYYEFGNELYRATSGRVGFSGLVMANNGLWSGPGSSYMSERHAKLEESIGKGRLLDVDPMKLVAGRSPDILYRSFRPDPLGFLLESAVVEELSSKSPRRRGTGCVVLCGQCHPVPVRNLLSTVREKGLNFGDLVRPITEKYGDDYSKQYSAQFNFLRR